MVRQKLVGHLCSAVDDRCTADVNGTFVQPSEGQQHGMKMMVQAEQMKVCMLKSLLLEMTAQQFSTVFLFQLSSIFTLNIKTDIEIFILVLLKTKTT